MFDNEIERVVVGSAAVLWFAHGWYLNMRLKEVHDKLDAVLERLSTLTELHDPPDPF